MAGLLGDVFSFGDSLKRKARGLLADPVGTLQQFVGNENDRAGRFNQLTDNAATEMQNRIKNGGKLGPNQVKLAGLLADAYNPAGMMLYHGGKIVKAPIADKQGAFVDGVPATSFTSKLLEAARYAENNRGDIYGIDASKLNVYTPGVSQEFDAAIESGNLAALKNAGFDGVDMSRIGSGEVALFDPSMVYENARKIAERNHSIYGGRKFNRITGGLLGP